ncbi:unnamed protein product [Camellia sinensis]
MGTELKHEIEYFGHDHILILCNSNSNSEGRHDDICAVCEEPISGLYYHCRGISCHFAIHNSCTEIPRYIQHQSLHSPQHNILLSCIDNSPSEARQCNACGCGVNKIAYKCHNCSFRLHVRCYFLLTKNPKNHDQQQQQRQQPKSNHPHDLILCDLDKDMKFSYTCTCCDLLIIDDGYGDDGGGCDGGSVVVYVCLVCPALLHKSCAKLPWKIDHPFHPSHSLLLCRKARCQCNACGKKPNGFTYHCSECEFHLDVHCASLKPIQTQTQTQTQTQNDKVQFNFSHPHSLIFCNKPRSPRFPIHCFVCRLPFVDSMICFCPKCKVLMHKSCVDLPQEIKHVLHPEHTLNLWYIPGWRYCRACRRDSHAFLFKCLQCKWYMDAGCALSEPPRIIMSEIHEHPLALFKEPNHKKCKTCSKKCITPYLLCVLCNFIQHVNCVEILPPIVQYKYHYNRLTLTDSPIKDNSDEDDDAEFYCDACEERRELHKRSYYCKESHYVAHPHCVASEIMDVLQEEWLKKKRLTTVANAKVQIIHAIQEE